MIDINNAVDLFLIMFDTAFWASMMIILVYSVKIVFAVMDKVKGLKLGGKK